VTIGFRKGCLLLPLVYSLLAAAGAHACEVNAVATATTPAPIDWDAGKTRLQDRMASIPDAADLLLIGDSLLAYWPEDMTATQFAGQRVWNFAVGGSKTQNLLWLLEQLPARKPQPKRAILLIGTNNLNQPAPPTCAIAAGIEASVHRLRSIWPQMAIMIVGVPPKGSDFHFLDRERMSLNRALSRWADGKPGLRFIEIDPDRLTCGFYSQGRKASEIRDGKTRSLCENYADDLGHFRRPGYRVIHAAIADALKDVPADAERLSAGK
jgi:lysophospholipase L1-like esterase